MKLFRSFTAIRALCVPVILGACGLGGHWARPSYDLSAVPWRGTVDSVALFHSHNDYEQENPLMDALMHGFDSVETDVWLRGGRFLVSHTGWNTKGTLEELYLDPLQKLVDQRGSVYGDGRTFLLWIDIKRHDAGLAERLHASLARYPMLSRFTDDGEQPAAVTVILTGSERAKKEYVRSHDIRFATRDSHRFNGADPPADGKWSWYSLKWSDLFGWEGSGLIPSEEWGRLTELVRNAHAKGRRIRFWAVPQTEHFWRTAAAAGVDTLATDSLPRLRSALTKFLPRGLAQEKPERAESSATLRLLGADRLPSDRAQ